MMQRGRLEKSPLRFLSPGSLGKGMGSLMHLQNESGRLAGYHGYDTLESGQHRLALSRAAGGLSENVGTIDGHNVGMEKSFQAMSNRLRSPVENLIGAAGVFKGGGLEAKDSISVLQRLEVTLKSIERISDKSPEYLRRSAIYLEGIQQLSQQQLAVSGRLTGPQMVGFQGVVSQLTTGAGFDPSQAVNVARMMQQRTMSPGGGAPGEIFQMRAFGFANPNLEAYQKTAQNRGIDPGMFKKRGLFEYRKFMETASLDQKIQSYLVGLETEYGGNVDSMSYILGTALVPELGQERAKDLIGMHMKGGLSTAKIGQFRRQGKDIFGKPESAMAVALTDTTDMTSTMMKLSEANDKYLNTMLNFGNAGGIDVLQAINSAFRDFQSTAGEAAAGIYSADMIQLAAKSVRMTIGSFFTDLEGMFTGSGARIVATGKPPEYPPTGDTRLNNSGSGSNPSR
jgi:hypothetical protein